MVALIIENAAEMQYFSGVLFKIVSKCAMIYDQAFKSISSQKQGG